MRWTSRDPFLSSCCRPCSGCWRSPIFPLGYSLYLALLQDRAARSRSPREEVPVLDDAGQAGAQAGRHAAHQDRGRPRDQVTTCDFVGARQLHARCSATRRCARRSGSPRSSCWSAVPTELALGLAAGLLFNRQISGRPVLRTIMILPIFATPLAVGYLFFTIFYEEGGPLGWTGIPWLSEPAAGRWSR